MANERRTQNSCETCEKRGTSYRKGCLVFTREPDECWAHTTDSDWARKVNEAVRKYQRAH